MHQPLKVRFTLYVVGGIIPGLLSGQPPDPAPKADLSAPGLQANANLTIFNISGPPLGVGLSNARSTAASKGIPWTGLTIIGFGGTPAGVNFAELPQRYQQRLCRADLVTVGHTNGSASRLSVSGTTVYTDYDFAIDQLLKDNRMSPAGSAPDIVVTRLGGSLSLPDGHVNFNSQEFPQLQPDTTYLQFLRYIPVSSSYTPVDSMSTLIAVGNNWMVDLKAFSNVTVPGFTRGALEASTAAWLATCNR